MIDGASALNAMTLGFLAAGRWTDERQANHLDGAAPYYSIYRCQDGHMAVGCVEPKFWHEFLDGLGLASEDAFSDQANRGQWTEMKARIADVMQTRTRTGWAEIFPRGRACVSPVLSMREAARAPHNVARGTFAAMDGKFVWPSPAPRFSRTQPCPPRPAPHAGEHTAEVLSELKAQVAD
jgi:alpha-methylacyl-CoA racemase